MRNYVEIMVKMHYLLSMWDLLYEKCINKFREMLRLMCIGCETIQFDLRMGGNYK